MRRLASEGKSAAAFRTIGEVAQATGIAPHILRYWEGRFPQLRPVTRAGNRRYYRPADITLIEQIDRLLNSEGYTIKGVQQLLAREGTRARTAPPAPPPDPLARLIGVRDLLRRALDADQD